MQIPLVSRLPIGAKTKGFRALNATRQVAARGLRALPGSWKLLGLPSCRVRSLKKWIDERRADADWIQRGKGAYYQTVFETTAVNREPPHCVDGDSHPAAFARERYHVHNEAFLARIPGARMLGPDGTVVTPDGGVVEESTWGAGWIEHDRSLTAMRLPKPERVSGACFTIASAFSEGFAHWILEALPRLYSLARVPTDEVRIAVAKPLNSWQRESLELLGVDISNVITLGNRYLEADVLYFPSFIGEPGNPHPEACAWLREKLLGADQSAQARRRIYITRRRALKRRVVNEDELEPILIDHGFEVIASEDLHFREEVRLFSQAEAIVSSHGAGLTNALFAPKGCKLLEFFDPNDVKANNYALANVLGDQYWYFVAQSVADTRARHQLGGHDDIHVPAELLSKSLAAMLKS